MNLECDVKRKLGDGDVIDGELDLLRRRKAHGQAAAIERIANQQGKDLKTLRVNVSDVGEDGRPRQRQVAYADLVREAQPLAGLEAACVRCPANALMRAFGCQGGLQYPIKTIAEQWLLRQVQTFDTVAGPYLVHAFDDGNESIAMIDDMRARGLFESRQPPSRDVGGQHSPGSVIDSSMVFEALLARGPALDPGYCVMILLGLAAIRLDGEVATSAEAFGEIVEMEEISSRQRRTSFAFEPDARAEIPGVQSLLRAMYFAWRNDVPLLMDA